MKKFLVLLLASFLVLTACGNKEESKTEDKKKLSQRVKTRRKTTIKILMTIRKTMMEKMKINLLHQIISNKTIQHKNLFNRKSNQLFRINKG